MGSNMEQLNRAFEQSQQWYSKVQRSIEREALKETVPSSSASPPKTDPSHPLFKWDIAYEKDLTNVEKGINDLVIDLYQLIRKGVSTHLRDQIVLVIESLKLANDQLHGIGS